MNVWFISDTHFCHKNIIKYCGRPFNDLEEMELKIIKNWNQTVSKDDIVWFLGDFAFASRTKTKELIAKLNGRKRMIMGNHDNYPANFYLTSGFEFVSKYPILWQSKYLLSHEPIDSCFLNFYGHVHIAPDIPTYCRNGICICADRFNFTPVKFDDLLINWQEQKDNRDIEEIMLQCEQSNF